MCAEYIVDFWCYIDCANVLAPFASCKLLPSFLLLNLTFSFLFISPLTVSLK